MSGELHREIRGGVVVPHGDDGGGVLVDGLEHGLELGFPCGLGISRVCGQYEACRLGP